MLDGYDITPNGIPDADDQLVVLLLWSLPVTALLLAMVWLRRIRSRRDNHEETQR
jgi:cytochrome c-type biogenesis protein CcmH/NrfF